MNQDENTQVRVTKETRLKLHKIKKPGMSYNDVIEELLKINESYV